MKTHAMTKTGSAHVALLRLARRAATAAWVALCLPRAAFAGEWRQWGGSDARAFASAETGLPAVFAPGVIANMNGRMVTSAAVNVKWTAPLGNQTYGNPTVAGGRVFVGANDAKLKDPRLQKTGGGLLLCFDEATGALLWRLPVPRLKTYNPKFNFDNMGLGICSSPTVEGDRLYLVSSRGEVLCLDVRGQADGNAGPYTNEGAYIALHATLTNKPGRFDPALLPPSTPVPLKPTDGDIIWRYDMLSELDAWPQDAADCSIAINGDHLIVATSNGRDSSHTNVPSPTAPDLIVLDKNTGALLAVNEPPLGTNIFHGEWSSPALARVGDRTLIIWGGGDGVCHAYDAAFTPGAHGRPGILTRVWWFDCNPPQNKFRNGVPLPYNKNHEGPSEIIATPAFYSNRVYVSVGQDSRHGVGPGCLSCFDATGTGEIRRAVWQSLAVGRTFSSTALKDGLAFVADYGGLLRCFDAESGTQYWFHDLRAHVYGTALVADGKVYIGDESGAVTVFACAKVKRVLNRVKLDATVYTTPIAANGTLFVASQRTLYAIAQTAKDVAQTDVSGRARELAAQAGFAGGVVALLGCGDGELAAGFCQYSNAVVHVLERDPALVEQARTALRGRGCYGQAAVELLRGARLPYADNLINVMMYDVRCMISTAEITRVLARGGTARSTSSSHQVIDHKSTKQERLERGPAFDHAAIPADAPDGAAWPMYRHDIQRSGATTSALPGYVELDWVAEFGSKVTAPVAAGGRVFVGLVDRYAVVCLDAATGEEIWTATCGAHIDTPPTIAGGRVVFGCADGSVYCLRARDGTLIWRFRAAPEERLIGAFDRLESAWPVRGSVLVVNGLVYALAGRSSDLDGGMYLHALDLATGAIRHQARICEPDPDHPPVTTASAIGVHLDGALPDILVSDGTSLWLRQMRFDLTLARQATTNIASMGDKCVGLHLVFTPATTFGVKTCAGNQGGQGAELFANRNDSTPGFVRAQSPLWSIRVPLLVKAMIAAGDRVIFAGPRDVADAADPLGGIEGRKGVQLQGVLMSTGAVLMNYALDEMPVWDGMAAAYRRMFVSTENGRVLCLAQNQNNIK